MNLYVPYILYIHNIGYYLQYMVQNSAEGMRGAKNRC